ncbi:MAG: transporter permease [Thermomicrobiales bacterium]|jgi:raffinose/stachyose/melibiose transport system permease protein|nr:transporter permease [Thermomicrobiales bacterium]MDF3040006.1 transporter permease [Thermomicrobiales bacterium]
MSAHTAKRPRRDHSHAWFYAVLTVLAVVAAAPLVVMVFNALKDPAEIGRNPLGPPSAPHFANLVEAWERGGFATTMRNSAVITTGTVLGVCVISGLAAYALGRLNVPGSDALVVYLFVGTTIPGQLFVIPLFFLWVRLGLSDTHLGLIIVYWAIFTPFTTLLLRSYLLSLPRELEEAARIDGAGELQVLARIVLPLAWPGMLVVALVTALMAWNEFFFAITILQSQDLKPVTTSFLAFQGRFTQNWAMTSAAAIIVILPMLVLFLALQRRFIAGMTAGALKG